MLIERKFVNFGCLILLPTSDLSDPMNEVAKFYKKYAKVGFLFKRELLIYSVSIFSSDDRL